MTNKDSLNKGVLSSSEILLELGKSVIIEPFNREQLGDSSYDVTLGENYFESNSSCFERKIYNPWRLGDTNEYWGNPKKAISVESKDEENFVGLPIGTKYISIKPKGSILGHTQEFIGGRYNITTLLHARSSIGRSEISVCNDAGCGNIGYFNRWTMEIRNLSDLTIVLPIGTRIAQILFIYTGIPINEYRGKYQIEENIENLQKNWNPYMMVPKLFQDRRDFITNYSIEDSLHSWYNEDKSINYIA